MTYAEDLNEISYTAPDGKTYTPIVLIENQTLDIKTSAFAALGGDTVNVQDIGRGSNSFEYTFIFNGPTHNKKADEFFNSIKTRGNGTLLTAFATKAINVQVVNITRTYDSVEGRNQTIFNVSFIETFEITVEAKENKLQKIKNQIELDINSIGSNLESNQKIQTLINKTSQINAAIKQIDGTSDSLIAGFTQVAIKTDEIITAPARFISSLNSAYKSGFNAVETTFDIVDGIKETYASMFDNINNSISVDNSEKFNQYLNFQTFSSALSLGVAASINDNLQSQENGTPVQQDNNEANPTIALNELNSDQLVTLNTAILLELQTSIIFIEGKIKSSENEKLIEQGIGYASNGIAEQTMLNANNAIGTMLLSLIPNARKKYTFQTNEETSNFYAIAKKYYDGEDISFVIDDIEKNNSTSISDYIYIEPGTKITVTIA